MNRPEIARYIKETTAELTASGVSLGEILKTTGISRDMFYQLRQNIRPASWEHALDLSTAYPIFNPRKIAPEFFNKLSQLNLEITKRESKGDTEETEKSNGNNE